ncbi:22320_t:CDS:1, partial [Gigaspora margarita]
GYKGYCNYYKKNLKYEKVRDASTYDDAGISEFTTNEYEVFQILQN